MRGLLKPLILLALWEFEQEFAASPQFAFDRHLCAYCLAKMLHNRES